MKKFAALGVFALLSWLPHPEALSAEAWQTFAVFAAALTAIISQAYPVGVVALAAAAALIMLGLLPAIKVYQAFGVKILWLIPLAYILARAFISTGLGRRVAYHLIARFGRHTLGSGYALAIADLILAPAIPSTTARAGGILFPVSQALAETFDSRPGDGTGKRIGTFLTITLFQADLVVSAMFLTSMAANPVVAELAAAQGVKISWSLWCQAAIVPGLCSLAIVPLLAFWLEPPELGRLQNAKAFAQEHLQALGAPQRSEWILMGVFLFLTLGWGLPGLLGLDATSVALLGVVILLLTGVLSWEQVISEKSAWDALIWFSVLVLLANQLTATGFTGYISGLMGDYAQGHSVWFTGGFLGLVYFFAHYFFASSTAQVTAMYPTFLYIGISADCPAVPWALALAIISSLYGGLTHYAFGHAPIFFGAGYVSVQRWWQLGLVFGLVNLLIWGFICLLWWPFIGLTF